jgi:hypothetical protein
MTVLATIDDPAMIRRTSTHLGPLRRGRGRGAGRARIAVGRKRFLWIAATPRPGVAVARPRSALLVVTGPRGVPYGGMSS